MERTKRSARWAPLLALGLVAVFGVSACGGGGNGDGVATLGGDNPASDGPSSDGGASDGGDDGGGGELSEDEIRDAQLEFARCMREHGIDMPDPQIGEDGETIIQIGPGPGGGGGTAPDEEEMAAAQEACQHFLEKIRENAPAPDPEEVEEMKQKALDFAACMRDEGVEDFPDPEFMDDGGVGQKIDEGVAEDPDFEAAQEHCAEEVGMEGPGGGPRFGGGRDRESSGGSS